MTHAEKLESYRAELAARSDADILEDLALGDMEGCASQFLCSEAEWKYHRVGTDRVKQVADRLRALDGR